MAKQQANLWHQIRNLTDWIEQEQKRGVEDEVIVSYTLAMLLQWLEDHKRLAYTDA